MNQNHMQDALRALEARHTELRDEYEKHQVAAQAAKNELDNVSKAIAALGGETGKKNKMKTLTAKAVADIIEDELEKMPNGVPLEDLKVTVKAKSKELGCTARGIHRVLASVLDGKRFEERGGVICKSKSPTSFPDQDMQLGRGNPHNPTLTG